MSYRIGISSLLSAIVFLGVSVTTEAQDCVNYAVISNARRSTMYMFDDQTAVCDDDLDPNRWYRFRSYIGNQIPERQPPATILPFLCGTQIPMYIRGTKVHPTEAGVTVLVTTCENRGQGGDNCNVQGTAQIHRCSAVDETGDFYIYRLPVPQGCHAAFCAGENPACDDNLMWNGFECVNNFPAISGTTQFSGPHTTGTGTATQIYFRCSATYNRVANDANARFKFTFLFDGFELVNLPSPPYNKLPSFIKTAANTIQNTISADLTEFYLRGRLGKVISCQLQTYWEGNSEMSQISKSASAYKVAIESDSSTVDFDMNLGTQQPIIFRSTVPLTCFQCTKYPCQGCRYSFPVQHSPLASDCFLFWKSGTTANLDIQVKPNGRTAEYELKFTEYNADLIQNRESLWHGYKIPPVTINVYTSDSKNKICSSSGDPHITTFDGLFHNNYLEGHFSLASAEFDNHKLEIQTHQEKCWTAVTCNCAIIVREFNSAYRLGWQTCGEFGVANRRFSVTELMVQNPSDGSEVMKDATGKQYSVRMASGLRVEINAASQALAYTVYLPPEYHGKMSATSQCGNCDGQRETVPNPQASRITDNENNYFLTQPKCDARYFFPLPKACDCDDSSGKPAVSCSSTEQDVAIKSKANTRLNPMLTTGVICQNPGFVAAASYSENTKSDYSLDPEDVYRSYEIDLDHGQNVVVSWPTPKGKTEAQVDKYCRDELKTSAVYSDCANNADIDGIVGNCKADIQIIDEFISVDSYREIMEEECVNNLIWKEYQINSTNVTTVSDEFMSIYNKVCPNQCSGHGTCSDSICSCKTGYAGADCSIDQSQPPQVTELLRDGLCNIQERPCATITVYGVGLYSSEDLKCRFKDLKTSLTEETNGTFITSNEVRCPLPATSGDQLAVSRREISLSNDGKLFGSGEQLVVYDSTCMSCSKDKVCTQKTDSCLISERCYINGSTDNKTCFQCDPSKSTTSWTVSSGCDRCATVGTGSTCIRSCDGRPDGDYQSCKGCDVYASCTNGALIDSRPCAASGLPNPLQWNDNSKTCDWESDTCTPC